MRQIRLILVFLFLCFGQGVRAQSFEWLRESKFDTIHYPGVRHVFVQMCLPDIDSVIANGSATFLHANIRNLGECFYRQTFKDTIITKVELLTKGNDGYHRLWGYFKLLAGESYNTFTLNKETTLIGYITRNGVPLCVTLFTDKRHKKNWLIMEPVLTEEHP